MESDGLDIELFAERLVRVVPKLVYIIPDFQNPSGVTTSSTKREIIVEWAERYGFWIVADSPYRALGYDGSDLPTLLSTNPKRVLHISSFSKVLSPGIRVGYFIGPLDLVKWVAMVAIVSEFCHRRWSQPNIEKVKGLYGPRLKPTLSSLAEHLLQAQWSETEGGFFVGVTLPKGMDTRGFHTRGEERRVGPQSGRELLPPRWWRAVPAFAFCGTRSLR